MKTMKKVSRRLLSVLLVIALLIPTGAMTIISNAEISIPDDAVVFNGHAYKIYKNVISWAEADSACKSYGGHLATITSSAENEVIKNLITASPSTYWIGAKLDGTEWKWITGEQWSYTNWASGEPAYSKNGTVARIDGDCDVKAIDGHFVFNRGEWDACQHTDATSHSVKLSGYVCEWENTKQSPDGYDFNTDRWKFENINETIDIRYYNNMFGQQKASEVYNWIENGKKHGHCFGMSVSTAATLFNCPLVTDYIAWTGFSYQKLSSVNKGTMNADLDITAKDYIKYCHIYQGSSSIAKQRSSSSHNGITNVYNAVLNAVNQYSDGSGIAIDLFWGGLEGGGHTVYAIGVDGKDILVNDSNEPGNIKRIEVNGNSWKYSGGGWTWSSSAGDRIDYVDDVITPYAHIRWGVSVQSKFSSNASSAASYTEEDELNGTNSYYIDTMEQIDADKLLVVAQTDSFAFMQNDSLYEVKNAGDSSDTAENQLYWLEDSDTVNAENTSGETATVKLVGNETKIVSEMPADSSAEMTVNEDEGCKATYAVANEDELAISVVTLDDNNEFITATVTGTASGDTVTAEETDGGIQVTGLNDMTVTLETADGTDEISVPVDDGETVNITVDDENNTVTTDWQCKHPDENRDGVCDVCGEDFTKDCSCICHSDCKLVQFFYKIARFFRKLFGVESKRYCECGKAHW